jgi:L-amino acid N-acyltransferase YncA
LNPSSSRRRGSIADLPRIVEIYNSTVASREVTADTEPVSVASRQQWFDDHNPEKRPLWVIHDGSGDASVLGWMSYSNFYGRPAYAGTAELSIYIAEEWRGKGIGRYCLEQAVAFAPSIAVHTLLGFIFGHNVPSLALFKQVRLRYLGQSAERGQLDGIERDLVILGKRVA